MIWMYSMRHKEHITVDGAKTYSYKELDQRFGRAKFSSINEGEEFFLVWPENIGRTRAYRLSSMYTTLKRHYVKTEAKKTMNQMGGFISMDGKTFKSIAKPIASKREDGSNIRLWQGVEFTTTIVPVNTQNLESLYKATWSEIKRIKGGRASKSLFALQSGNSEIKDLELRAEWAATLLVLANTTLGGHGWLPMRYREAQSGRLYAMDDNLQNCPRKVRKAALDGFYDYDISNCHYTLLAQYAAAIDMPYPAIQDYITRKTAIRDEVATHTGSDLDSIKTCLLALIYGAKLSAYERNAIGRELGKEKANKLLTMPLFMTLAQEVNKVSEAVLNSWPVKSGSLINVAGGGVKQKANNRKKLSHLLQGAEALILKTAVEYLEKQQPGNVILLQHDGFTAQTRIDNAALTRHIEQVTGSKVIWEETRIQPEN